MVPRASPFIFFSVLSDKVDAVLSRGSNCALQPMYHFSSKIADQSLWMLARRSGAWDVLPIYFQESVVAIVRFAMLDLSGLGTQLGSGLDAVSDLHFA